MILFKSLPTFKLFTKNLKSIATFSFYIKPSHSNYLHLNNKILFSQPHFFFTTQTEPAPSDQELKEHFFGALKQYLSKSIIDDMKFSSSQIYYNKIGGEFVRVKIYSAAISSVVWMLICVLTYQFIHPFVSIIPGWFFTGNILKVQFGIAFLSKISYKINLFKEKNLITFTQANNKQIHCRIKDITIIGIFESTQKGLQLMRSKNITKENLDKFLISYNAIDLSGKTYQDLRILISDEFTAFENIDLFIAIMHGNEEKVQKFQQVFDNVKEEDKFINLQEKIDTVEQIQDITQETIDQLKQQQSQQLEGKKLSQSTAKPETKKPNQNEAKKQDKSKVLNQNQNKAQNSGKTENKQENNPKETEKEDTTETKQQDKNETTNENKNQ